MKSLSAIVLAAGRGTRMNAADIPKVLFPLSGRPMLAYVLENLANAGIYRPVLVVGYLAETVKGKFGGDYDYAFQSQQNGTATAVLAAKNLLESKDGVTVIASGDQPFISPESINRLISSVEEGDAKLAVLAGRFESPEFDAFGRVIVDADGQCQAIVEAKNANREQLKTRLFNLGTYAVDNEWLWNTLPKVSENSVTGEYYLTDLVELAVTNGDKVSVVETKNEYEATGINTPEHLKVAEEHLAKQRQ